MTSTNSACPFLTRCPMASHYTALHNQTPISVFPADLTGQYTYAVRQDEIIPRPWTKKVTANISKVGVDGFVSVNLQLHDGQSLASVRKISAKKNARQKDKIRYVNSNGVQVASQVTTVEQNVSNDNWAEVSHDGNTAIFQFRPEQKSQKFSVELSNGDVINYVIKRKKNAATVTTLPITTTNYTTVGPIVPINGLQISSSNANIYSNTYPPEQASIANQQQAYTAHSGESSQTRSVDPLPGSTVPTSTGHPHHQGGGHHGHPFHSGSSSASNATGISSDQNNNSQVVPPLVQSRAYVQTSSVDPHPGAIAPKSPGHPHHQGGGHHGHPFHSGSNSAAENSSDQNDDSEASPVIPVDQDNHAQAETQNPGQIQNSPVIFPAHENFNVAQQRSEVPALLPPPVVASDISGQQQPHHPDNHDQQGSHETGSGVA